MKNRKYSVTGIDHMYTYTTWTRWCWNRTRGRITSPSMGWSIYIDNDSVYWRGQTAASRSYWYQWRAGYANSGHVQDRQGEFENCYLKVGCTGTSYPRNILRAHSNGTWTWWTDD